MAEYSREEQLHACLALIKARKIGPITWQKIIEQYPSPAHALADHHNWLEAGAVRADQYAHFTSRSWEKDVENELKAIAQKNLSVILWSDPEYPERLRQISGPPIVLYYTGDLSLLAGHGLAVVGSRQCSRYGREMAMDICRDLSASGLTIISGFAYGIDRQAHLASVDSSGGTIAVLGTGIDLVYPAMNRDLWIRIAEKGLIVTEFFPGTKPDPGNFPFRNRIISGLSLGVLVVQSTIKSGSMITAKLALEQNKEVFAVPGAANMDNHAGCNQLIRQGAHLVQNAEDILEILAPILRSGLSIPSQAPKVSPPEPDTVTMTRLMDGLDPKEKELARIFEGCDQIHIDELTNRLDWSSQEVSRILVMLEIKGLIKRQPGMYFSLGP